MSYTYEVHTEASVAWGLQISRRLTLPGLCKRVLKNVSKELGRYDREECARGGCIQVLGAKEGGFSLMCGVGDSANTLATVEGTPSLIELEEVLLSVVSTLVCEAYRRKTDVRTLKRKAKQMGCNLFEIEYMNLFAMYEWVVLCTMSAEFVKLFGYGGSAWNGVKVNKCD